MMTVQLSGWNVGFNKVKFTKLLQESLGYSLMRAKRVTDTILDDEEVTIEVPETQAEILTSSMRELGARCAVVAPVY